jgi:hypothetical protein
LLTRLIGFGILSVEVTELQVCGKEISSLADKRSDSEIPPLNEDTSVC